MTDQTREQMTHEAFFAHVAQHPDTRFDFMDGELVEVSPKPLHGYLQAQLITLLSLWLRENPIGVVHTEVLHVLNGENFIPDVSVNASRADDRSHFDAPPLLAVEIRSDTQSRAAQRRKARRYVVNGTPAVLLVLPNEAFELFTPQTGDDPQRFASGQTVAGIPASRV